MKNLRKTVILTLISGMVVCGLATTTLADDRPDVAAVRQMFDEARQLRLSLDKQLEGRDAALRHEIEKLLSPAANDIKKAQRRLAEDDVDPARRDAERALRLLRKAEERLAKRNG